MGKKTHSEHKFNPQDSPLSGIRTTCHLYKFKFDFRLLHFNSVDKQAVP